jgi:hypothetical protein
MLRKFFHSIELLFEETLCVMIIILNFPLNFLDGEVKLMINVIISYIVI